MSAYYDREEKFNRLIDAVSQVDLNEIRLESEVFNYGDKSDVYHAGLAAFVETPANSAKRNYFNRFQLIHAEIDDGRGPVDTYKEWHITLHGGIMLSSSRFPQAFRDHVEAFVLYRKQLALEPWDDTYALNVLVDSWKV